MQIDFIKSILKNVINFYFRNFLNVKTPKNGREQYK